jgi:hypothetical protein
MERLAAEIITTYIIVIAKFILNVSILFIREVNLWIRLFVCSFNCDSWNHLSSIFMSNYLWVKLNFLLKVPYFDNIDFTTPWDILICPIYILKSIVHIWQTLFEWFFKEKLVILFFQFILKTYYVFTRTSEIY